jgi:PTS hybrid protein
MVGLVVVSHSATAAAGIVDVAAEMGGDTTIEAAGGDDGIGTDADRISDALAAAADGDGVVVLLDLGSAVMNAEVAVEMHDGEAVIADAPVLEGAVNAAVAATDPTATLESVVEQAEAAADISKT